MVQTVAFRLNLIGVALTAPTLVVAEMGAESNVDRQQHGTDAQA